MKLVQYNNRYLLLTGITYFVAVNYTACTWNFWIISEIFHEIFRAKNSLNFTSLCVGQFETNYTNN